MASGALKSRPARFSCPARDRVAQAVEGREDWPAIEIARPLSPGLGERAAPHRIGRQSDECLGHFFHPVGIDIARSIGGEIG